MIVNYDQEEMPVALIEIIKCIPNSGRSPQTTEEISRSANANFSNASPDWFLGATYSIVSFFEKFGLLAWENDACQLRNESAEYFVDSLCWFFANRERLLVNWDRKATPHDIGISNLLETAPYFLKIMEERRKYLSDEYKIDSGYSRNAEVSIVFIKSKRLGKTYFLHKWDEEAACYQLIGGRSRTDRESKFETAKRSLRKEISPDLVYERDFKIVPLSETALEITDVSRSCGALTKYKFWFFKADLFVESLELKIKDHKWIALEDMMDGITDSGDPIASPENCRLFDKHIPVGLENIPDSIKISRTQNLSDFIEVELSFGFFTINISKAIRYLTGMKKRKKNKNRTR